VLKTVRSPRLSAPPLIRGAGGIERAIYLRFNYNQLLNASGVTKLSLEERENYELSLGVDNPGVANPSLQMSGRFTGLLQSPQLQEERKLFWIDFEDELLANIKTLLKNALAPDATPQARNLVDYVLGLDEYKPLSS